MTKMQKYLIKRIILFLVFYAVWIMLSQSGFFPSNLPYSRAVDFDFYGLELPTPLIPVLLYITGFLVLTIATLKIIVLCLNLASANFENKEAQIVKDCYKKASMFWMITYIINALYVLGMAIYVTFYAYGQTEDVLIYVYHAIIFGVAPLVILLYGLITFFKIREELK